MVPGWAESVHLELVSLLEEKAGLQLTASGWTSDLVVIIGKVTVLERIEKDGTGIRIPGYSEWQRES